MSEIRSQLYPLADALGMALHLSADGVINGSRKTKLDLFEGYCPTVITSIEQSLVDKNWDVIALSGHVWGNLGFVIVLEKNHLSFFIIDRSKLVDKQMLPSKFWSRKVIYGNIADATKAVYHRSVFDTEWSLLDKGPAKLREYNEMRNKTGGSARAAYDHVWGGDQT